MDTIVAIATPTGVGGLAVIRISGDKAKLIAEQHLEKQLQPRRATFGVFRHEGREIDEVVATYFAAPHSYTTDDVVEISCHGSLYVQQAILAACVSSGARMAEPGEFTQRAFLGGRLNLSQAEAVADLIDSTNAASHTLAVSQLRGAYSQRLQSLRQQFVNLTSLLELELDFSEEDVEFADRRQLLAIVDALHNECRTLADTFRQGNAIKNGVPVAIIGRPNVGKSTLLNALLGDDRAIVSDIAGTTRDTIEDTLTIDGITFRFIDTAGIRQSTDQIENAGIERSYAAAAKAQVVLYLVAADAVQSQVDAELSELAKHIDLTSCHLILLQTKTDTLTPVSLTLPAANSIIPIAARQGVGIDTLKQVLAESLGSVAIDSPMVTNQRHYEALRNIAEIMPRIRESLQANTPADLVVIDIRDALYHLGTITGEVSSTEVLSNIFHRFCIGK